ncbi:hypothetical protein [Paraliomyxa miuraensis]|uniref:hypothetical protein n=1 Tax=Paraliomyxa miuraensis TaxID=376150 RepID=UPI00224F55D5|nr:hypothetical protein [Paraliomyxa miuraensis]MCX4241111.1 hypothetical protein [Paraliomyxa miuraensis]
MVRPLVLSIITVLGACHAATSSIPSPAPSSDPVGLAEASSSAEPVSVDGTGPLATEVEGWRDLLVRMGERREHPESVAVRSDDEARERMCDSGDESRCKGPPPWLVRLDYEDATMWIHYVVDVGPAGLVFSEPFGIGSMGTSCNANTKASIRRDGDRWSVTIEDSVMPIDEECECEEGKGCECHFVCTGPFKARCTFTVTGGTLALGQPDAECDATKVTAAEVGG